MEQPTSTQTTDEPASFRDPSGFVFYRAGRVYRQVNEVYREQYEQLMGSGLYDKLVDKGLLVPHDEVADPGPLSEEGFKVLAPEPVPFVSYPYEWCFSQLQDAARATLRVQWQALAHGMSLKDASAYNIQFHEGRPVFIDTLSFEPYREGEPWIAYGQFCRHFLAPLALMAYRDHRLGQLLKVHVDGIPLDLASRLLPLRSWGRFSLLSHLHLHARAQSSYGDATDRRPRPVSRSGLEALIETLNGGINSLALRVGKSTWSGYYEETNYSDDDMEYKVSLVTRFLDTSAPAEVWDLGANTGRFSRLASERGIPTVAMDFDFLCVEAAYRRSVDEGTSSLLPIVMDLANPSPALGWGHAERRSLADRGPVDVVLALALIHHLAIGNNVPLDRLADFFSRLCRTLIIEFVPKSDSQVERMLASREDIFPGYTQEGFEAAFSSRFVIAESERVAASERTLYLMHARG